MPHPEGSKLIIPHFLDRGSAGAVVSADTVMQKAQEVLEILCGWSDAHEAILWWLTTPIPIADLSKDDALPLIQKKVDTVFAILNFFRIDYQFPPELKTGVSLIDAQHANIVFYLPPLLHMLHTKNVRFFIKFLEALTVAFMMHYETELIIYERLIGLSHYHKHRDAHSELAQQWRDIFGPIHIQAAHLHACESRPNSTERLKDLLADDTRCLEILDQILSYVLRVIVHIQWDKHEYGPHAERADSNQIWAYLKYLEANHENLRLIYPLDMQVSEIRGRLGRTPLFHGVPSSHDTKPLWRTNKHI